jgi:hypothetical protein
MSPQQGRPSQGDLTGRQKMAAAKTASVDQQQGVIENARVAAEEEEANAHGVFDGKTNQRVDQNRAVVVTEDDDDDYGDEVEDNVEAGQFGAFYSDEQILTGKEDPATIAPIEPTRRVRPPKNIAHDARVTVRFSCDIEKATYGMTNGEPNNYDFKEGRAYEIPYEVAEHFNGLGVIGQWLRGR